jgi:hypothetical protein
MVLDSTDRLLTILAIAPTTVLVIGLAVIARHDRRDRLVLDSEAPLTDGH